MKRKAFPLGIETQVILKCRRRCALCYFLDNDLRWKRGQLAHIDRDPSNCELENAAYLCAAHHEEYDIKPSQTKRFTPAELKASQAALYEILELPDWWRMTSRSAQHGSSRKRSKSGTSLAVYERRLPVYRTTVQFVRDVLKDLRPELPLIFRFNTDTEEALFLFDETVAAYLAHMFKKALRLHTVNLLRERMARDGAMENFSALVQEETALAEWFSRQYDVIRSHFAPFLHPTS